MMKKLLFISGLTLSLFTAQAQIQSADFEAAAIPADWTTEMTGPGDWTFGSNIPPFTGNPTFASNAAIFNDDALGNVEPSIASLLSPVVDLTGYPTVSLSFDYYFNQYAGSGTFAAEVFDGAAWQQLLFVTEDQITMLNATYDVTAYKNANFQVRFTFDDEAGWSWGAAVDNFALTSTLAVLDASQRTAFSMYPNPASNVLHFDSNVEISHVAVSNLSGQKVLTMDMTAGANIDISHLASGAYFVTAVFADQTSQTTKLIKK